MHAMPNKPLQGSLNSGVGLFESAHRWLKRFDLFTACE